MPITPTQQPPYYTQSNSLSAKKYTALIAQLTSTSDNPTVTHLIQNQLNQQIIWTRLSAGTYDGTITSQEFTENKTILHPFGNNEYVIMGLGSSLPFDYGYTVRWATNNIIRVRVYKTSDYSSADLYTAIAETPILIDLTIYQ